MGRCPVDIDAMANSAKSEGAAPAEQVNHVKDHDRQYELNRRNFEGRWCSPQRWFSVPEGGEAGAIDFEAPQVTGESVYDISWQDEDHFTWHGTGLRFAPGGEKILHVTRESYNGQGTACQFDGWGAQTSLNTRDARLAVEANFFDGKGRRSMLITMLSAEGEGKPLVLKTIGEACFRNSHVVDAVERSETVLSMAELLSDVEGFAGRMQWRSPTHPLDETWAPVVHPSRAMLLLSEASSERAVHSFRDGLMMSMPIRVEPGKGCDLVVGCHLGSRLDIVMISYGNDGDLTSWQLERYEP